MSAEERFVEDDSRNLLKVDVVMLGEYLNTNYCYNVAEVQSVKAQRLFHCYSTVSLACIKVLFGLLLIFMIVCCGNISKVCRKCLTRAPGRLLPSDSGPVLQYVSGPSSGFLAKILGVDTPPFLWKRKGLFYSSTAADRPTGIFIVPFARGCSNKVEFSKQSRTHTVGSAVAKNKINLCVRI
jgi:hypothetical protein